MELIKGVIGLAAIAAMLMFVLVFSFAWFVYLPIMTWLDRLAPKLKARIEYFLITGV